MKPFVLSSPYTPAGDQPEAINSLVKGISEKAPEQVLLGVTGSGKTFTMAHVIQKLQRPTLIISHNKTLAAQLYQEFRDFFPENAVSYFVSYYDYYQPEAYIPSSDTFIEKETQINQEIDKLRLAATTNLLTRKDTIIIASVSCIYNIGSPREYGHFVLDLQIDMQIGRRDIFDRLAQLQYERSDYGFHRGTFRVRGNVVDIFPAYEDVSLRIELDGDQVKRLSGLDPLSGKKTGDMERTVIYPAKHYMTDPRSYKKVFDQIRDDLDIQVNNFQDNGKMLEAHRINQRVNYDLEMIAEMGYVNGVENYSRYFDGRKPGDAPYTLFDYYQEATKDSGNDWLLFVDESHMTIPQIRGMYNGDRSRKQTLIDYGFRLPSALDNRPLKFDEFLRRIPQTVYVSATPAEWELGRAASATSDNSAVIEQIVRPTGLLDPTVTIRPIDGQVQDVMKEIDIRTKKGERVLVTTLTKRMAEDLSTYLEDKGVRVHYLHSDVQTLERSDILADLRRGTYDVVVGINLLREGLDLPEVSLVAILDADREGFLRSHTSLVQTMGRAARHERGEVILYADRMTRSIKAAVSEVERRREVQIAYNKKHNITPTSIDKPIRERLVEKKEEVPVQESYDLLGYSREDLDAMTPKDKATFKKQLMKHMRRASKNLEFELAARLRDFIAEVD